MTLYVKKAVPVEARLFTAFNIKDIHSWIMDNGGKAIIVVPEYDGKLLEPLSFLRINTLEGTMSAFPGVSYVVKGVRGEFYPCAKDIFDETYEEFEEN